MHAPSPPVLGGDLVGRAALDALVARAARAMVEVSEDGIDRVTEGILADVGRALDADVVSLVRHVPNGRPTVMEVTHRWFAPRNGPLPWPREYDWTKS
ncbi:MAG: hypothetical protein MUE41_14230, partial [Gemmatimonadaceae bacterium]|nr:hypothetical protein [Gemmatimonadaceae bacterium]